MHGAKELGISVKDYFLSIEHVVEGQKRLQKKYRNDCFYAFHYASIETEAFGGETIFIDEGPPNAGAPVIASPQDILSLELPNISESPGLMRVLEVERQLKAHANGEIPIIGVVMSPFSLPVMQMGFGPYLDLLYKFPAEFKHLMQINEEFCVNWANAQLEAGATAICFFDPVSSQSMVSPEQYAQWAQPVVKHTISRIKGPTATHFASGRCEKIIDLVADTGTAIIGVSIDEDMRLLKMKSDGRLSLLGNLNGIEMRHWSSTEAEAAVKKAISQAGKGGGFILSDNHGEIPFQVPDETLLEISEARLSWGQYPLQWIADESE
jgi:uroporphyrinogen decarboxylase